ncbi:MULTISPECIES: cytochrome b/b6 domain-containing protein [unclassified Caballeronia]|uniref:cytochrome b n=1 Tax=unclassified Caballeronia TaxID=2646786 RepID=UPI0028656BA6|nr:MULTISPECIES: cytochrome b/b6 domain-containing protein [unclassified Caballeronia]MDR5821468.1 cytochrome b/b6 domain-containing protein [Caballeronia sp. LZ043]MDR5879677.1 cytochrome b/b6 domain-containing protein [Caballeronia sp. LZ032]
MAKAPALQRPAYDVVARTMHWLTVLLIAMQFVIGWTMPDVHKDTQPVNLIAWHLGVGATLVTLMAVLVIWRLTHRPPPDDLPPLFSIVSRVTHFLLYTALVLVPLLGWINASSGGWAVRLLSVVPYPALSEPGSTFGHAMGHVHGILAWVLFALIGLLVVAALFHRHVRRDHVLQRMLPRAGLSHDPARHR